MADTTITLTPGQPVKQAFEITASAIYVGWAARGTPKSSAGWTIKRVLISANNPTDAEWTDDFSAIWDNRTTETYR